MNDRETQDEIETEAEITTTEAIANRKLFAVFQGIEDAVEGWACNEFEERLGFVPEEITNLVDLLRKARFLARRVDSLDSEAILAASRLQAPRKFTPDLDD